MQGIPAYGQEEYVPNFTPYEKEHGSLSGSELYYERNIEKNITKLTTFCIIWRLH